MTDLAKYVTRNEHRDNDQEPPQTCLAMRFANETLWVNFEQNGIVCEINQGAKGTDNVSIKLPGLAAVELAEGEWFAYYPDLGGACVYTDAEFRELYEPAFWCPT